MFALLSFFFFFFNRLTGRKTPTYLSFFFFFFFAASSHLLCVRFSPEMIVLASVMFVYAVCVYDRPILSPSSSSFLCRRVLTDFQIIILHHLLFSAVVF